MSAFVAPIGRIHCQGALNTLVRRIHIVNAFGMSKVRGIMLGRLPLVCP